MQVTRATDPAQLEAGLVAHVREHQRDGWTWTAAVTRGPNGLTVSRLEIQTDDPAATITSRILRSIPLGTITSAVQVWLEASEIPALRPSLGYESAHFTRGPRPDTRPGRAPLTDTLLRDVAEGYLRETGPDKPRGAIKRLAEQLDRPEPTVSRWVVRARKEGWLGPATPCREGAEPE
jgi:DNA-binding IclR family transcriptional regulator